MADQSSAISQVAEVRAIPKKAWKARVTSSVISFRIDVVS